MVRILSSQMGFFYFSWFESIHRYGEVDTMVASPPGLDN